MILGSACASEPAVPPVPPELEPARWQLTFSDDFGGGLDRWNQCFWWAPDGCSGPTRGELQWYEPGAAEAAGGTARLRAERRSVTGDGRRYPYRSAMLTTGPYDTRSRPRFAFTYGYVEARLRVNLRAGAWPKLALFPASRRPRPEIAVLEVHGAEPDVLRPNLRSTIDSRPVAPGTTLDLDIGTSWHTYSIEWEPGRIIWRFDGAQVWEIRGAAVPSEPMYPIATLAVGGRAGPPDDEPLAGAFELDWVRVWQR